MRVFTEFASDPVRHQLNVLINQSSDVPAYRDAMLTLGRQLADAIAESKGFRKETPVCIVCTVEDADYLARGLLEQLSSAVEPSRVKLVCFWNERVRRFSNLDDDLFDVAPVVKAYREDVDVTTSVVIVVKSIISGACVVKTNLATLIDHLEPLRVVVAAPVMLKDAEKRLGVEFPKQIADRFEYVTFAVDDQKENENVLPGIGGSVYERLGFENKTTYVPKLVKERRLHPA